MRDLVRAFWTGTLMATMMVVPMHGHGQAKKGWRQATPAELEAVLPARATVEKERIETEMRTASGVIDGRGRVIAAVVLITAGYAANGKYSHYLLLQAPVRLGADVELPAGNYVLGWTRSADGLAVRLYKAETGVERGAVTARPMVPALPVVSIKVWPPGQRSILQIGRFALPYKVEE
jgi:hypothetical protein